LTGEDGFEIFVPEKHAVALWQMLIDQGEVMPSGLGARDTLRLEAGLCLYGHDIDDTTTPSSAGLSWTVGKSRREAGAAPFPGSEKILAEVAGPKTVRKVRTGLVPKGAPAREGAEICLEDGTIIGKVCVYLVHAHHLSTHTTVACLSLSCPRTPLSPVCLFLVYLCACARHARISLSWHSFAIFSRTNTEFFCQNLFATGEGQVCDGWGWLVGDGVDDISYVP